MTTTASTHRDGSDRAGRSAASTDRTVRLAVWTLVVVAFAIRVVALGERALHHDESLDAWFSQRFLEGTYDGYDPVYHGPLRFYLTAGLYWLFGISVESARLISVLAGSAIVGLPYFLRHRLGPAGTVATAALLCFSPTFLYFSRFAREDAFFAFLSLLLVVLLLRHLERPSHALVHGLVLTLVAAWAVKETVFLLVLVTGSFVLVELAGELLEDRERPGRSAGLMVSLGVLAVLAFSLGEPVIANLAWWGALVLGAVATGLVLGRRRDRTFAGTRVGRAILRPGPWVWSTALALGAIVFVVLFTVLLTDWQGSDTPSTRHGAVLDGLVGGWDYWRSQQDVNRGGEPWFYYLFAIPAYELVAVVLAAVGAVSVIRCPNLLGRWALWASIVTIAAYSYAGERMPWLILHPLLPIVVLAGIGVQSLWDLRRRRAVAAVVTGIVVAVAAGVALVASFRVNYLDGEEPRELLSQAGQASPELAATVDRLHRLDRLVQAEQGRRLEVLVDSADSAAWPYVFYLRDLDGVRYGDLSTTPVDATTDVVISVDRNAEAVAAAVTGWEAVHQPHREWWVPSYTAGGFSGWFGWSVDRDVWDESELGELGETVYVSPDVAAIEARADDLGLDD